MGRPLKNGGSKPVRTLMEDAFWKLLRERSFNQISVSEIIRRVGCNRTTFYYYFESIEDMAKRVIEEAIPADIPALAEACFEGTLSFVELDDRSRASIERLCLVIGKGGTPKLVEQVKRALKAAWIEKFDLDCRQLDVSCVLEFMAGGVVGILGHVGSGTDDWPLDQCMRAVSSVFSKPAVAFAREKRVGASSPSPW